MIKADEYIQLKAFARQDGLFLGLLWVICFACLVYSVTDPSLQLIFVAGSIATPFITYYRLKHFRDKVLDGQISFLRAFAFVAFMMGYGSIIMAAATYFYFYFLDHGTFMNILQQNMSMPEVHNSLTQAGIDIKEMENQMTALSQSRPIDFALNVFSNGLLTALIMGAIIGFMGKRVKVKG